MKQLTHDQLQMLMIVSPRMVDSALKVLYDSGIVDVRMSGDRLVVERMLQVALKHLKEK